MHVFSLRLALSILMFHPPSLLFPGGHFSWSTAFSSFARTKIAGHAHSHMSGERRGVFSIWQIPRTPQVMSPNSPTRRFLWTVTRRPSMIQTTIAFLTSRKPHAKTPLFRVPTVCAPTSVSHASCGNVALPKESQPRETVR